MTDASKSSGSEPSSTERASTEASTDETSPTTTEGKPIATTTSGTSRAADDSADPAAEEGSRTVPDRQAKSVEEKKADRRERLAKGGKKVKAGSDVIRVRIASIVWLIAVLAAIVLSVGALLHALDANPDNAIVDFVWDTAKKIDGPFWKVFDFTDNKKPVDPDDQTKEYLVNWGLAAVAYLIGGRILDRLIRP